MSTLVEKVTDLSAQQPDVIQVDGSIDGAELTAYGWLSAMSNYYPPTSYDDDGSLKEGSQARAMDTDEKMAYWVSLLEELAPAIPTPTNTEDTVLFAAS
jgi:hypothetical protein